MLLAFAVSSCVFTELEEEMLIAEGSGTVTMDVRFRPLDATGVGTKAAGDAIKHVESLWVVVYSKDGNLYSKTQVYPDTENKFNYVNSEQSVDNIEVDAPAGSSGFAESKYCHSTFDMTLPIGVYRIYAVANYDLTNVDVASESKLQNISLEWKNEVAQNNAMFGFFTTDASDAPTSFTAPDVNINKSSTSLHAWVRRAASKVTVSFDGSNLYENVYIYIHSVQIKDIPNTCLLGAANTPDAAGELIADGETMYLRTSGSTVNTDGLRITKGVPTGGQSEDAVHSETANALYFYENMQGTDANKHQYNNFDSKDNKPYGTYIEVKGYYVNKTADNASQGPIIYRFMLGKNTTDDFNAERNNHYKVVLKFKNDANDPDWHIEYEPENPEISVPSPMYISYLHGEKLDIPVVVRGAQVTSFYAKIVDNDWYYEGHPMINTVNDYDYNGFLAFVKPDVNGNISGTAAWRKSDFEASDETSDANVPAITPTSPEGKQEYHYTVPVWTRHLQQGQGYSGNNAYIHKERVAKVAFTVEVIDAEGQTKTLEETIDVIQVKRVVNPAGIWRPSSSDKEFHIVQMEADDVNDAPFPTESNDKIFDDVPEFRPTVSDGPWTAKIISGNDWVRISKDGTSYSTDNITGSTGTKIDFYYKPSGTNPDASITRCGVIQITYHNNTCVHYVFVSQGAAPVAMGKTATRWHMTNLHCQGVEEATPLHEGSMFRYLNTYSAILAENNFRDGYGVYEPLANITYTGGSGELWTEEGLNGAEKEAREWPLTNDFDVSTNYMGAYESEYTLRINFDSSLLEYYNYNTFQFGLTNNRSVRISGADVASCAQWNELKDLERYYGVLYGDSSTETLTDPTDVYEFPFDGTPSSRNSVPYKYDKGMRGMFVWDREGLAGRNDNTVGNGHIFFPIGATGHGHRMHFPDWGAYDSSVTGHDPYYDLGMLKYATSSQRTRNDGAIDYNRPMLYDLYLSPGAIYWTKDWIGNDDEEDNEPFGGDGQNAMDINYQTYDFNTYAEYATWRRFTWSSASYSRFTQSSDACFIRCVDK